MIAISLMTSSLSFASVSPAEAQKLFTAVSQAQVKTDFFCDMNGETAVSIFRTSFSAPAGYSNSRLLTISNKNVCDALSIVCPFVARVFDGPRNAAPGSEMVLSATRGKNEDSVMMFSDGNGVKIVNVANGSQPRIRWDKNWYFEPGLCTRN